MRGNQVAGAVATTGVGASVAVVRGTVAMGAGSKCTGSKSAAVTRFLAAVLLAGATASGGTAGASAQTVAITGGEVHVGDGTVLPGATVLMVDGRIAAVGADVTVPTGARRVDAAGKIVTPGLFDAYTGLGLGEISLESNTVDRGETNDRISAAFNVAEGLNPYATHLPVTRVEGITTAVVTPQTFGALVQGQGLVVDLGGTTYEEMVVRSPAAMYAVLGEAGAAATGGSRAAALLMLKEALDDTRDYARNREAFAGGRRRDYALSRLDLEAMIPVVRGTLPLVLTANRASDILAALRFARDNDVDVMISGAAEGHLVADELAASRVPVLLNAMTNLPAMESLAASYENAALLHAAGANVVLVSYDTHNSRNLRQIAGFAVSYGMPHGAALEAVTRIPAEVFGVGDEFGTLEGGKRANVVIWTGDPFELTTWAETVFIGGVEVSQETRQKALFDRYRDLGRVPR